MKHIKLLTEELYFRRKSDEESWRAEALLITEKSPPDHTWETCECLECYDYEGKVLDAVSSASEWSLARFYQGPGRAFAHEPVVYKPVEIHGRWFIKVTWSGGLDI